MLRFTSLLVLSLFISLGLMAQDVDRSPFKSQIPNTPFVSPNATFDVQFNYAIGNTVSLGNAGTEFDGNYIWVNKWNSNLMYRFSKTGIPRDSFAVSGYSGASGMRDLAFDGRYIYGGVAIGTQIVRIDTGTLSVVKTITTSIASIRAIAWDPVLKGFWVCGWADAIVCVDTNGVAIAGKTIPNAYAGKYGLAYDGISPGGPFLWVFDQTNANGGSPQAIYKWNLNTLTYTGISLDVTTKITNAGSLPLAGGLFITDKFVPGYATIGGLLQGTPDVLFGLELAVTDAGPLMPFNLTSPAAGSTITSIAGSTDPVTITWDTSRAAATYKWIYGTALPTRLHTIPAGTNSITMTLGQLDVLLGTLGLNQGDSISGSWDVWAFRNNAPINDSLKSANGPRLLKLKRQKPALTTFGLISPVSGSRIETASGNNTPVLFNWGRSGAGTTYKWFYASPNFSSQANIKFRLPSNNSGFDTLLTTTSNAMDGLLSGMGVAIGDSTIGQWRVYAYSDPDSLASAQTNNITFKRLPIVNACIGTGTIASSYPFYTLWQGPKSDMLFLASEIISNGGAAGQITQIGFNVLSIGAPAMSNFYIKMQTTSQTSLTGFISSGWTTVVGPISYAPPATGLQNITLATPYTWNGTGNLAVEICYQNTSWTSSSTVTSTAAAGMTWGQTQDPLDGCSLTAGSTVANRPNACFKINTLVGVNPIGNTLPTVYSLSQNYPNPFNPVTKINFALPKQGFVTLKIFDVLGREVRTLVNEVKSAGQFSVDFNASEFASGVYFYRLESNGFSDIKRMMLIK